MSTQLIVPESVLSVTLAVLQRAGLQQNEGIVLWLGDASGTVLEAIEPDHEASSDFFRIPPVSMRAILSRCRNQARRVVAQVHSHPCEAFHSQADDAWAIVRHHGALSLVLPYFAQAATVESFVATAAAFSLSNSNRWEEVSTQKIVRVAR